MAAKGKEMDTEILDKEHESYIKDLFDAADTDKSGLICKSEMLSILNKMMHGTGQVVDGAKFESLWARLDSDKDGSVSCPELVNFIAKSAGEKKLSNFNSPQKRPRSSSTGANEESNARKRFYQDVNALLLGETAGDNVLANWQRILTQVKPDELCWALDDFHLPAHSIRHLNTDFTEDGRKQAVIALMELRTIFARKQTLQGLSTLLVQEKYFNGLMKLWSHIDARDFHEFSGRLKIRERLRKFAVKEDTKKLFRILIVTVVFKLMYSATEIFVTEHDQQVLTGERYWKSIFEQLRDIGLLKVLFTFYGAFFPEQLSANKTSPFYEQWEAMYKDSANDKEREELHLQLEIVLLAERYACDIMHHLLTSHNQITANGAAKWLMSQALHFHKGKSPIQMIICKLTHKMHGWGLPNFTTLTMLRVKAQTSAVAVIGSMCRTQSGLRYLWSRDGGMGRYLNFIIDNHIVKLAGREDPRKPNTWAPDNFWYMIKRFASDNKDATDYTNNAGLNLLRTLCWLFECVSGSLLSYKDRNIVFRESSPTIDSLALFLLPDTGSGAEKLANFQTNLHEMPVDTFAVAHWCNALKHIAVVYFSQDGAKRVRAWPGKRSEQFFGLLKKLIGVEIKFCLKHLVTLPRHGRQSELLFHAVGELIISTLRANNVDDDFKNYLVNFLLDDKSAINLQVTFAHFLQFSLGTGVHRKTDATRLMKVQSVGLQIVQELLTNSRACRVVMPFLLYLIGRINVSSAVRSQGARLIYQILSREAVKEVKSKAQADELVEFLDQYDIGRQLAHALQFVHAEDDAMSSVFGVKELPVNFQLLEILLDSIKCVACLVNGLNPDDQDVRTGLPYQRLTKAGVDIPEHMKEHVRAQILRIRHNFGKPFMHSVRQFLLVVVDFTKSPVRGLARWQGGKWAGEKLPREIQAKILTPFRRLLVWLIQHDRANAEKDAPPPDKSQLEGLEKMTSDFLIGFKEATTARHQAQAKLVSSTALKRSVEAILFVDIGNPTKVINGVKIELVLDAKTQMDRLKVNLLQEVYQHFQNSQLFRKPNFLSHLALVFANHDDHPHKDAGPLIESLEWQAVANPAVLARQADLHLHNKKSLRIKLHLKKDKSKESLIKAEYQNTPVAKIIEAWLKKNGMNKGQITKPQFIKFADKFFDADINAALFFEMFDLDNNGSLDGDEFFIVLLLLMNPDDPRLPENLFERFDKDKSGRISISELIVLFRVLEPGITKDECVRRLEEYDEDRDEELSLGEFKNMLKTDKILKKFRHHMRQFSGWTPPPVATQKDPWNWST